MTKRILITGALGFIGSHVADRLVADGHTVVALDDLSGNVVERIPGVDTYWNIDAREIGIVDGDFDLVVHAASPVGAVALLSRSSIVAEIIETTQAVLRFCVARRAALVNIASSEVYGFSGVYRETDDCVIQHRLPHRIQYAAGKLAAEQLVRTARVPAVSIRPFNIAGPRQTAAKGFVIPTFCEQAITGRALTVFGTGFQERCPTAVWDMAEFIATIDPRAHSGLVVNIGNPDNRTTVLDLAQRVIDIVGPTGSTEIAFTDGKAVHGPEYEEAVGIVKVPDIALARSLGWEPRVGLDEMIARTCQEVAAA